jgi:hypothetical protein
MQSYVMKKSLCSITVLMISLMATVFLCGQAWAVDVLISQLLDDPDPAISSNHCTYFEEVKKS